MNNPVNFTIINAAALQVLPHRFRVAFMNARPSLSELRCSELIDRRGGGLNLPNIIARCRLLTKRRLVPTASGHRPAAGSPAHHSLCGPLRSDHYVPIAGQK